MNTYIIAHSALLVYFMTGLTMGMNFAFATISFLLTFFSKLFSADGNLTERLNVFALILMVVGVFNFFFIKSTFEEWGTRLASQIFGIWYAVAIAFSVSI